ncbi:MAG TPA: response regulator [Vicinamibacterales bacterium]|jgi:CheY-like chemotaxis protein|nr:response regulator [Vicinamibacterales bacterium]
MAEAPLILVVDDSLDNREAYVEYLRYRGFRTLEAATGEQAVAMALRHNPDLVVLDLLLPDIDGLDVSQRIRSARDLAPTKIIAVSARVFPSDVTSALASGCDAFLQKPCLPDDLVREMERLLDLPEGRAPRAAM